ncbi:MAG: hypothetical protein ACE5OW_01190 [Candidatus Bathyarchaeia archaeon]
MGTPIYPNPLPILRIHPPHIEEPKEMRARIMGWLGSMAGQE